MEKEQFNKIITNYQTVLNECDIFVKALETEKSLESLTINEFTNLIHRAQILQSKSDKIVHNEFYHLIGMGDLTATQTMTLCAIIKKIAQSRSYFKPVASYILNKLPQIPDKSDYKCDIAGIKLISIFNKNSLQNN